MGKIRVGLVFGGRSGEHEVSVRSATSIYNALNREKFEVELMGIDRAGKWLRVSRDWLPSGSEMKSLPPGERGIVLAEEKIDVFLPIVHGTYGEDGSLQGLFELLDVAYVGAGVLGSAVGMDKDVMKRLLKEASLSVAKYVVVRQSELSGELLTVAQRKLGWPMFVKPANMGSSVGVSKVMNLGELKLAVIEALKYDTKAIVEEMVLGKEIEVAVLGNDEPIASVPGEIRPTHEFYDYEAKYIDENGAELVIPAQLQTRLREKVQKVAVLAFKVLECSGMGRVDMFVTPGGKVVVNEINTLPGFTSISMYPKLWEASGISYSDLLERLIDLALEKKRNKDKLKRSFG